MAEGGLCDCSHLVLLLNKCGVLGRSLGYFACDPQVASFGDRLVAGREFVVVCEGLDKQWRIRFAGVWETSRAATKGLLGRKEPDGPDAGIEGSKEESGRVR